MFRIEEGQSPFVIIEQFEGSYGNQRLSFEHASTRALALKTMIPRGAFYKTTVNGAKLFLDDVCAAPCDFANSLVYARQLNPENLGTHVRCAGGLFWVLGLKTEKAGAIVEVTGGGRAEILGRYNEKQQRAHVWPWGDVANPEKGNNPDDHNPCGSSSRCQKGMWSWVPWLWATRSSRMAAFLHGRRSR